MLTRMFAYFTLVCYLVVGAMVARFCLPNMTTISLSEKYLEIVTNNQIKDSNSLELKTPELNFAEIKIVKPVHYVAKAVTKSPKKLTAKLEIVTMKSSYELPFHEPVKLTKIEMNNELPTNMVALYKSFEYGETLVSQNNETVQDVVSTAQAVAVEVEPEFFEYPAESNKIDNQKVAEINNEDINEASDITEGVADLVSEANVINEEESISVNKSVVVDYAAPVTTQKNATFSIPKNEITDSKDDSSFIGFDYSRAKQDIVAGTVPKAAKVDSHKSKTKKTLPITPNPISATEREEEDQGQNGILPPPQDSLHQISLSIRAIGTDLNKVNDIKGYEVRFQDDLSESQQDYGSGEIVFESIMNNPKMTRSVTILKRGFVPTSTEVILEEGSGSVSIPILEEEVFNNLMLPHERKGLVGGLLVELDDETEVAKIDVPFGEVITLDGDFRKTNKNNYRYQLFLGVKSGNALVSYHKANKEVVSKIIHVHEHEMTYDANFYEEVTDEKIKLFEEDLLARENSPLIISGNQVKVFAKDAHARKINNHTYKVPFGSSHLGGRRYLELNHQSEPVFVGIRDNNTVTVPSENFMRFMLSKVEGSRLGNRCLVQINLVKEAQKFEIASESVSQSLMINTQVLDSDGKFYDSLSAKTRKIIVIGENQGSTEISPDSKINIKILYQDGSVQYLNSYCSPNTYLVEQL
jgi:hypothetical protein